MDRDWKPCEQLLRLITILIGLAEADLGRAAGTTVPLSELEERLASLRSSVSVGDTLDCRGLDWGFFVILHKRFLSIRCGVWTKDD